MVDIRIGLIPPVLNNQHSRGNQQRPLPEQKSRPFIKERRKKKADRRKSVRDGFVVTLSTQLDRRQIPDRRRH
jgi:hypothetical protein